MVDRKNPTLLKLSSQMGEIMSSPERVYDLVGRRLAATSILLQEHFSNPNNTFRLAVIGNPNVGKTTYAYSLANILKIYQVPSTYIDLDIYTESGKAISNEIGWGERRKRSIDEISLEETQKNINEFATAGSGIVIGDFPGKISNEFQSQRLKNANFALILGKDFNEIESWKKLCDKNHIPHGFLISRENFALITPDYPQADGLNRKIQITIPIIASATGILQMASRLTNGPKINLDIFFSQAECGVLEEIIDYHFSIQNI